LVRDNAEKPRPEPAAGPPICAASPRSNAGLLNSVLSLDGVQEHPGREANGFGKHWTELGLEIIGIAMARGHDIRRALAARQRRH
jgi:hypothetical protein